MSQLDQLIAELCPDGVEYKSIEEIFYMKNGYTPSTGESNYWENGTIPWFRMEDIRTHGRILSDSIQHITRSAVKGSLFLENSIILATSATIGEHALISVEALANQRFTCLSRRPEFLDRVNMKFFYHFCFILDEWCLSNVTLGNFLTVDIGKLKKFKVPLPPLPVQEEIVRILDTFTALEAELESELEVRRKQYKYYSRRLIENLTSSTFMKLRQLGDWFGGGTPSTQNSAFWDNGTIPWVSSKDMIGTVIQRTQDHITPKAVHNSSTKMIPANSVAVVVRSGILRHTLPIVFIPFEAAINQDIKALVTKPGISPRYVAYTLRAYHDEILNRTKKAGGTVESIVWQTFLDYSIPVPLKGEQDRIVSILDRFDSLVNDITQGLPAELAARRKQYEYYRDKLLTFKEKVS